MSTTDPEVLIARHVEKLMARSDKEKVDAVLSRAGLSFDGRRISGPGRPVRSADCSAYKHAVRDVYGDAVYAFTKVNFVLGGCTCPDCVS